MSFIAGHYTSTYDGNSIGTTREGFNHVDRHHHQDVIADEYGEAPADGIQQGTTTEVTLDYVEYDLIDPALYAQNTRGSAKGNVGKLLAATASDLAKALVLTSTAGTPAASTPATRTYFKAIIITDVGVLLASKLRQGPCTFRCFPNPPTGGADDWKTFKDT